MAEDTKRAESRTSRTLALLAIGLLVLIAPELIGGRPAWAVIVITLAAGAAALSAGLSVRRGVGSTLSESIPLFVLIAALAWTCLQCLPLPIGWAASINPEGVEDARATAELLGEEAPSWWALSRSPWSTAEQVLHGCAIVAAFAAAWWHSIARRRDLVAAAIGSSAALMAVVALVHHALGATEIFGLYRPWVMGRIESPLINDNHLAGFLAMGTPVLIGLGLHAPEVRVRLTWWLAAFVTSVTCVLAISRSGLGSLAVGLFVLAVLTMRVNDRWTRGKAAAAASLVVGFGILIAAIFALDELWADLASTNLDKVRIALRGLDLVAQDPWLGLGRGAYSEAFVRLYGTSERVEQPENILVQWASEWGLPMAIMMLAVLSRAWLGATRTRSPIRWGALAGVASIAAHDLLDFAMEVTGIAVVAAALLAVALAPSAPAESGTRSTDRRLPIALGVAALAAVIALGPGLGVRRVRETEAALAAAIQASDYGAFDDRFLAVVRLHPGEPTLALLRGHVAVERRESVAPRWLNRAMTLAPGWSSPHLVAARWLIARGAFGQAWLELREAEARQAGSGYQEECALAERPGAMDDALRVFANRPPVLDALAHCPALPAELAARIDQALLSTDLSGPRVRIAQRALARGEGPAAVEILTPYRASDELAVILTLAAADRAVGRPADAVALLEDGRFEPAAGGAAYSELARAYADAGNAEGMRDAISHLRGGAHGSAAQLAAALSLQGSLELQLGNTGHALRAYEQATRLDPDGDALARIAALSESLGDHARAYRAWSELCRRATPSSQACLAAERLRGGP